MNIDIETATLKRLNVKERQVYDLEMLLNGGFSPLNGFLDEENYNAVVQTMHLLDGTLWPIPIVLDVSCECPHVVGDTILLCDTFGNPLASMDITSRFIPDKTKEVMSVYGSSDTTHPGVQYIIDKTESIYIGGPVKKINLPSRTDFVQLRKTPTELKNLFLERGWDKIIGFQTRNPMHRAHFELVRRAHEKIGAPVLVHPVVGMTKPGDIDYVSRVHTYDIVCNTYGKEFTYLSLLPLAMRMAGPREALWHAIIRKNYGCTHFIVGRDHAGPGKGRDGKNFYSPYEARDLSISYADEIGVVIVPSEELAYSKTRNAYITTNEITSDDVVENISGTECRRRLRDGEDIPEWFSFKESIDILRKDIKKGEGSGIVFFFTGLPCSGKSTIAELLRIRLHDIHPGQITFLDGDVVRMHLSKGLGFSKEDRDENVRRVGFVASEIAKHGGITICSMIAPYKDTRRSVRNMIEEYGTFIEIFVDTSIKECVRRDTKGLYEKARKGLIKNFTGVDDPYEIPENPEFIAYTEGHTSESIVEDIIAYLYAQNILTKINYK